jgi:CRP/FNR family cyclic AMP-dependent transcriptional regulator
LDFDSSIDRSQEVERGRHHPVCCALLVFSFAKRRSLRKSHDFMTAPAGPDRERALQVLSTASNRLEYLTGNDWSLLVDKARFATAKRGETLLRQGDTADHILFLIAGAATVQVYATKVAQVGPGEICGEMAFLEGGPASATVTANHDVTALLVDWTALTDLFELFPHLASRFYRSLAVALSRRLRDQLAVRPNKNS